MLTTTPRTSVVQPDGGGPGDDDDASSRASSPSKSPLGGRGVSPFLDTQDQPLARQPAGVRAGARVGARASQQGLAGGPRPGLQKPFDAGAADAAAQQEQPRLRSPSQLGRRPALPNWQDMQDAEDLAPDGGDAGVLSGGQAGMPAAPLFGGGHAGAGGGMFGAAPGGFGAAPGGAAAPAAACLAVDSAAPHSARLRAAVPAVAACLARAPRPPTPSPTRCRRRWTRTACPTWGRCRRSSRARRTCRRPTPTHRTRPGTSQPCTPRPAAAGSGAATPCLRAAASAGWRTSPSRAPPSSWAGARHTPSTWRTRWVQGWLVESVWGVHGRCHSLHVRCSPLLWRGPLGAPLTTPLLRPAAGLLAAVPGRGVGRHLPHRHHLLARRLRRAEEGAGRGPAVPHAVRLRPIALHPGRHAVHLVRGVAVGAVLLAPAACAAILNVSAASLPVRVPPPLPGMTVRTWCWRPRWRSTLARGWGRLRCPRPPSCLRTRWSWRRTSWRWRRSSGTRPRSSSGWSGSCSR